ncbi:hypothetical protein T03_15388 [Trichinella britovi]|uniref:Uncharacterized protein n=1 Tax=Trichinella britovi TaxID=45882 RepID=A0A0V1C796_TRIBR|nr:hypothetical protein T03_15388 [Trichinella britovi]
MPVRTTSACCEKPDKNSDSSLIVHPTIFAVNTSETRVSFVAAKSKVAPLKKLTLLCVRVVRYVLQELALPVDVCYCWSDSLVALSCIRGDACRLLPDPEQYCIPGESRMEHLHPCRLSDMVARPILVRGDTSGLADVRRPKHIRKRG